jgi:hypothetical protein
LPLSRRCSSHPRTRRVCSSRTSPWSCSSRPPARRDSTQLLARLCSSRPLARLFRCRAGGLGWCSLRPGRLRRRSRIGWGGAPAGPLCPLRLGGFSVAVGLGAGGFFAIYPCIEIFFTSVWSAVYYGTKVDAIFIALVSASASCRRLATSPHYSSTSCSADGEEEWEVCYDGGWRGGYG